MAKATAAPGNAVGDAAASAKAKVKVPARGADGKWVSSKAAPESKPPAKRSSRSKTKAKTPSKKTRADAGPDVANTSASSEPKKPAPKPIALVLRLYKTIEGELAKLENQRGTSSQDRERASRALSQTANSMEKAFEMHRVIAKNSKRGDGATNKEALAHAEDLRRQIAERLERLRLGRVVEKRPG